MSPRLALHFLGIPELILNNTPITTDRRKAVALLAYLGVNGGKYSREYLSGLLWPEYDQAKAFSNLRRTIWEVHQAIGETWLLADRESITLNPKMEIDLDVARFQDLLSQSQLQTDPELRIALLVESVKLYRNHFLTGFSLKDAYQFNEWAYAESDELRRKLADALTMLSEDYCTLGQAEKAIPHARRLISLDPLNESSHRQLMEVYIRAGQHSAAMKQYQTCEQILRKELNLDPQPETRALHKKIRKGDIKQVRIEEKAEAIEPKHNLPLQLSSFVGREKETDDVANLIAKHRLVTVAGVGGIGKTRLSLQVGQKLLNHYPDGAWFIRLDSLADPALAPQTVASVFDIREGPDRPVIEILMKVLHKKTTLLILDNCEHLLDACAQLITTLLSNCPNIRIFATSREILNVEGEATYYLPSLSTPEDWASLEKLTQNESIQLFTERARLASSSFALTKENAQTIVDICHRVDGIPLAIELAAARINILQVEEIHKQLQDSFTLLSNNGRMTLQRHQTLQASMDWSWGLLNEAEQRFLRQLSVFAGGWTLDSAQAVCEGNILDLMNALVKKSLIVVDQATGRETRYRFHEIVRQYMREKLEESGEEENARTRHLKYFLQFSEQAKPSLRGPMHRGPIQMEWYGRVNDERDNIRTALEWADNTDVEAGLYISGRLQRFWEDFDIREGMRWLEGFLKKVESGNYLQAKASALQTYAMLLMWLQQFAKARTAAQECLEIQRALGDRSNEMDILLVLADTLIFGGEFEAGMELIQQAHVLSESIDDIWRKANVLYALGYYHHEIPFYWEEAIVLFQQVGDWDFLMNILGQQAFHCILDGDVELAQKHIDEAEALREINKNTSYWINGETTKSLIALARGDTEQAHALIRRAMVHADESGHRMGYLWARVRLGYIVLRLGNLSEARAALTETAREFLKDKFDIGVVFALEGMAELYIATNKAAVAARLIGWADAMRKQINDSRPFIEQADVDKIITACLLKMGEIAFSDAYDEGQKMSMDQAVGYVLDER